MTKGTTSGLIHHQRLDSWKSIARHLGRSLRTALRWHAEYGLPVHHVGADSGSVYAYADELDAWLRNHDRSRKSVVIEMPRPDNDDASCRFPSERNAVVASSWIPRSKETRAEALVVFAYKLWESMSHTNLSMITGLFREAVDLDPVSAEAFAGLSQALIAGGIMGDLHIPGAYVAARAAVERALEIDGELPEARSALAWLKMVLDKDWTGARREFDACLRGGDGSTHALVGRGLLSIAAGNLTEAADMLQEAMDRRPLNARTGALLSWSRYLDQDYGSVLSLAQEMRASGRSGPVLDVVEALASVQCEPPQTYVPRIQALIADSFHPKTLRGVLGGGFALAGETQRAERILAGMGRAADRQGEYGAALVLIGLGQMQDAAQCLEQCFRRGSLWSFGFPCDPALKPLRQDHSNEIFLSSSDYPTFRDFNDGTEVAKP